MPWNWILEVVKVISIRKWFKFERDFLKKEHSLRSSVLLKKANKYAKKYIRKICQKKKKSGWN